jgi:hypothetical protein
MCTHVHGEMARLNFGTDYQIPMCTAWLAERVWNPSIADFNENPIRDVRIELPAAKVNAFVLYRTLDLITRGMLRLFRASDFRLQRSAARRLD